jgi:two-component system, NtrC family, response regulator AtoC
MKLLQSVEHRFTVAPVRRAYHARGEAKRSVGTLAKQLVRILVVEDDDDTRLALSDVLRGRGYAVDAHPSAENGLRALQLNDVDVVLTDVRMPGIDGIELCRRLSGDRPDLPVVVMTAFGDVDSAVESLRAGAFDFVTKPFAAEQVEEAIRRAMERGKANPAVIRLEEIPPGSDRIEGIVGSSAAMREVAEQVARAAPTESTVLLTGDSGTGKELVARAIHAASDRREGGFIAMSCAAVPQEILEAELFGHVKGAFTGAGEGRVGLFQQANGGTLFLDEIGDMPIELQPKLLRALQERSARPIGGAKEVAFDARIVTATNKNLGHAVEKGEFRRELLFRINVLHIHLPPLRERGWDVIELARYFLELASEGGPACTLTAEAERLLLAYHWPGNVRELENCINAAVALASGGRVGLEELPTGIRSRRPAHGPILVDPVSLQDVERRHIEVVLRAVGWNKAKAARKLGIDRATLYRKLERLGLERR